VGFGIIDQLLIRYSAFIILGEKW